MTVNLYGSLVKTDHYVTIDKYEYSDEYLKIVKGKLNEKWSIQRRGIYLNFVNHDQEVPEQGFKIHVSTTIHNAVEILNIVSDICITHHTSFKIMLDSNILSLSHSKNYPRSSSGKFITIYPSTTDTFKLLLGELYPLLKDHDGPYVLSDRRYKEDCKVLYYRYGGFKNNSILEHDGSRTYLLKGPNNQCEVDNRNPYFTLPKWVENPFAFEEASGGNDYSLKNGRYKIINPLTFNNSGGIYLAYDNQRNEEVVIKESRPHTLEGGASEQDAIDFKKREFSFFESLQSKNITPEPIDSFYEWEHYFTVVSYVKGKSLREYLVSNSFLLDPNLSENDISGFLSNLQVIWKNIITNLAILHENNIFLCDFKLGNFIVKDDLNVIFIDMDGSTEANQINAGIMYTSGYIDPKFLESKSYSIETELYGLGSLLFATLSTYNSLLDINPRFVDNFLLTLQKEIKLPVKFVYIIKSLMNENAKERPDLATIRKILSDEKQSDFYPYSYRYQLSPKRTIKETIQETTQFITSTANTNNEHLFYTDPKICNPLNVENGALGVLYALNKINGYVEPEYLEWVKEKKVSKETYAPSLYLGLSGIAWTLNELGEKDYSNYILQQANTHPLKEFSSDIYTGSAGLGLANLSFWRDTNDQTYLEEAVKLGEGLIKKAKKEDGTYSWPDSKGITHIGHAKGASGIAVFLMYLYKATNDYNYLVAAKKALEHDISYAIEKDNFISFPNKTKDSISFSPYWFAGSAGVASALLRYRYLTKDNEYDMLIENIVNDSNRIYTLFPGLFNGLSGLGNLFLDAEQFLSKAEYREKALKIADSLNMFVIENEKGLAFPGDYLNIINNDYGSGASGIALFLNRIQTNDNNFNFYLDDMLWDTGTGPSSQPVQIHANI